MDTQRAREIAFKILYELEIRGENGISNLLALHLQEENLSPKAAEFVTWIAAGVHAQTAEYNAIIEKNLQGWKLERVSKLSIAAIKLALFEIENNDKINASMAIAEAVKLSVKYEGEEASAFVNGVLGNYVRGKNKDN